MIEQRDTTLGPMISGTQEEFLGMVGPASPVLVMSTADKLKKIKDSLADAGIGHIDIVYDADTQKVRYYKRSMALEGSLDDNLLKMAHRLGWHKFE